jgi:hypothetical protein
MTRYPEIKQLSAFAAYLSTGNGVLLQPSIDPTNGPGLTLTAATYLFPFGGELYGSVVETVMHALSALWPAGIVGTITIEATNFPKTVTGAVQGPNDVTDWDVSSAWQKIDPTQAGAVYATATGTGAMTKYTCAITAGSGGALWNIPELGALRLRARAALTTGGFLRMFGHAKLGS